MTKHILSNGALQVGLDTIGARTSWLRFHERDLMLVMPEIYDPYGPWQHTGAIVGPVGNRFTTGAHLPGWDGPTDGRIVLHGDTETDQDGVHHMDWALVTKGADHARFELTLPSGHGGFTANRRLSAEYSLPSEDTLRVELCGETDGPTLMTMTHHPYWCLGAETGIAGHTLQVDAAHMLPSDETTRPTGEKRPVADTGFDFTMGKTWTPGSPPIDNTFCLADQRAVKARRVACLTSQDNWSLTLSTTEPGLHVFDGRVTDTFGLAPHAGCCLEPQFWPDASRFADFPQISLSAGDQIRSVIEYHFTRGQ